MDESRLLSGRYRIGDVLGRGGMAAVRLGVDERLGRTVAVKILRADLEAAPTFRSRFRREARAAAALDHPAIVKVYDTGEDVVEGMTVPYIVMEYVDGRTLSELQRVDEPIPPERALTIMGDVLGALEYSHRAGIIHRDVKPANVMLTPTGAVKVMDFGIARVTTETAGTMTGTSTVIGTAHYLSPEQARGESADARSDVYSAGCTLYALLAGRPPFLGDSAVSVAYQHVREEPRPPSAHAAGVPAAAEAITMKALAKAPEDRYESAAQMRADIGRALAGQQVLAPAVVPVSTTDRLTPVGADGEVTSDIPMAGGADKDPDATSRRRRARLPIVVATALVVLVGVAALVFGDVFGGGPERQRGEGRPQQEPSEPAAPESSTTRPPEDPARGDLEEDEPAEEEPEEPEPEPTTNSPTPDEEEPTTDEPEPSPTTDEPTTEEPEPSPTTDEPTTEEPEPSPTTDEPTTEEPSPTADETSPGDSTTSPAPNGAD